MRAFVDESVLLTGSGEGAYVLAAVLCPTDRLVDLRAVLLAERRAGRPRWHWHGDSAAERRRILEVIRASGIDCLAAVVSVERTRQERGRRKALAELLPVLESRGVETVVAESRQQKQDRRDIEAIDAFRSQRLLGPGMRVDHERPDDEPLLWMADAVAGAAGALLRGDDTWWRGMGRAAVLDRRG